MAGEATPEYPTLSAQQVADAFVQQYYSILRACPENAHKFYKENSIMARPGSDGTMLSVTTVQGIDEAIMSSCFEGWEPNTDAVHAQDSIMGSVIVGVTGCLTEKDTVKRNFEQTFFLASQETGGFYVHNDFLLFLDVNEPTAALSVPEDVVKSPTATSPKDSPASSKDSEHEHPDVSSNDKEITSESDPTPKEAFEILKKVGTAASPKKNTTTSVSKHVSNAQEESKKISYASILAKVTAPIASPPVSASPKAGGPAPTKAPPLSGKASAPPTNGAPGVNGGWAAEAPKGIHIKDLTANITQEALLEEVKKFGAVKPKSIQIREYPEDGYRYAFVEFESSRSARSAVEAGEILIGERQFEVQYKKSYNQGGNNQGRAMYGRGGYSNEGNRGRDSEGRGGRNDMEARGSNWRNSTQDEARVGSTTFTKRNGGGTIRVE